MKKIYIITGANGFLGNNIIRQLTKETDSEIRALVLPNDTVNALDGINCSIFQGDVTKKDSLHALFDVPENAVLYVIHCAAIVHIHSKFNFETYDVNVNGTKNIAEKAMEKNAKLIYVNSVHAITEKPNHETITEINHFEPEKVKGQYAKTKAAAANYVLDMMKKKRLNACILHPSGMIGPNDFGRSHLTQLIIDFANGRLKACVKGGYDFVDVRDVADGVIKACTKGTCGECYILSNRYVEIRELLDWVSAARNTKPIKSLLPMWLARLTAPLSELYYAILHQPPLYTKYSLYTLDSNSNFSNEKARRALGFQNRNLTETIADTVTWLENHHRIKPYK